MYHFNDLDNNYGNYCYGFNSNSVIEAILNDVSDGKLSEEQVSMASCRIAGLLNDWRSYILSDVEMALNSVMKEFQKEIDDQYQFLQSELWSQQDILKAENKRLVSQASEDIALLVKGKKDFSEDTITRALENMFGES